MRSPEDEEAAAKAAQVQNGQPKLSLGEICSPSLQRHARQLGAGRAGRFRPELAQDQRLREPALSVIRLIRHRLMRKFTDVDAKLDCTSASTATALPSRE